MYIKVGDTIINTDQIAVAKVAPGRVEVLMAGGSGSVTVEMLGEQARQFLQALPIYEPVQDPADEPPAGEE